MAYTIEELRYRGVRQGRAEPEGKLYTARNGRKKRENIYHEYVSTAVGMIELTEWFRLAKEAVIEEKGKTLLEEVTAYCKTHFGWCRDGNTAEGHALECIVSGAFTKWDAYQTEGWAKYYS